MTKLLLSRVYTLLIRLHEFSIFLCESEKFGRAQEIGKTSPENVLKSAHFVNAFQVICNVSNKK